MQSTSRNALSSIQGMVTGDENLYIDPLKMLSQKYLASENTFN